MDFPWLRKIKVTFEGAGAGTFESTGKPDALRINCQITKVIQGFPAASTIMLYNLTPDTRKAFQRDKTKVRIEAGWEKGPRAGLRKCFYGSMSSSESHRAGPDIITVVRAIGGVSEMAAATIYKTWPPGTQVEAIVRELAGTLQGVSVGSIKGIRAVIAEGGYTHGGAVKTCLDKLALEHAYSWTIVDNVFQAIGDTTNSGQGTTLEDPWLIAVAPCFYGPGQELIGIKAKCSFDPSIDPAKYLTVRSKISDTYSNLRVNTVTHNLDCFNANSFTTDVVAYEVY